ncbi:hypothetical protein PVAP13_9NG038900 [Panicum virgatum]|uniref:Uncharacterized protein n=1 Tax=Panicum virgatum TaxID=38727 RepID=A0A8T0MG73_PANVG|nr:hypothetical protein PVAP13_9NG038900 [Panicum virgatum]
MLAKLWARPVLLATVQKAREAKSAACTVSCDYSGGLRRHKPRRLFQSGRHVLMTAISGHVGRGPDLLRRRTPWPNGPCHDTTPPCSSPKKKKNRRKRVIIKGKAVRSLRLV